MLAIDGDELIHAVGRECPHLRLQTGSSDGGHELGVGRLDPEHLLGRMPHRGEDDRAGIDDRAVQIEENDGKPHPRRWYPCTGFARPDMAPAAGC